RQVEAIPDQAWKGDFEGNPVFQCADTGRNWTWLGGCSRASTGEKGKRHPIHFSVFRREGFDSDLLALHVDHTLFSSIANPTQTPTHHLFTEELRPKGSYS